MGIYDDLSGGALSEGQQLVSNLSPKSGSNWWDSLFKTDNELDFNKIGGLAGLFGSATGMFKGSGQQPVGYQGGIPDYKAVRKSVQNNYDTDRRPGSRGRRYFTGTRFVDMDADNEETGGASNRLSQARQFAEEEAEGIRRAQNTMVAPTGGVASVAPTSTVSAAAPASGVATLNPVPTYTMESEFPAPVEEVKPMAAGGLAGLKKGKYLNGATDGMADKIPATIDRTQPAALSDGEFVIPADVVSHLGNGNSDAGAKVLTEMMDKVRMARTGNKKQGKEIDPNKFLPKV